MLKIIFLFTSVFTISALMFHHTNTAMASLEKDSNDGGFSPIDVNDQKIKEIALFAVKALASDNSDFGDLELVEIFSASKQIVGGINYQLNLDLKKENGGRLYCKVTVFDQPWTKTRRLVNSHCKPVLRSSEARPSSSMLKMIFSFMSFIISALMFHHTNTAMVSLAEDYSDGRYSPIDVNDQKIKEIALFAAKALASENSDSGDLELVEIFSAGKQIVGGINYQLNIDLKKENGGRLYCKVTVFDQPWTKTRKLVNSHCKPI